MIDPQTVEVTLAQPDGNFLFNMAWGDAVIVAPESIDDIKPNPVGTGPFKFADWVQGDRIELARIPRLLGRGARAEQRHVQVHLRPHRRLRRDDGGGYRRLRGLSRRPRTCRSSRPIRAFRCSSARPRARRSSP